MYRTADGEEIFVVDGHLHFWDASPGNQKNEYGKGWIDCFYGYDKVFTPPVLVTTVDVDPDLEKLMGDNWVQETNVAGSVLLGRVVVDTIVQKLNGESVPNEAYLVPQEITKDNLDSFDRSILYPPGT